MRNLLQSVFERYGETATVERRGVRTETKAFVQPVRRESADEPFAATPLGAAEGRIWRYLGPAEVEIGMGDLVRTEDARYRVINAAGVTGPGGIVWRWAVLRPEEECG